MTYHFPSAAGLIPGPCNIDSRAIERSRSRGIECRSASSILVGGRCAWNEEAGAVRSTLMPTSKISTHPRDDSVRTFCNSVAPVGLRGPKVVVRLLTQRLSRAMFATPNPLTSHTEKNLLSPFSNIRAITARLCTRSRLAILEDYCP
jgi:hypothetical protein